MKTTILLVQLLIFTSLFGQTDSSKIWTGDVITFTNGETKRVNIIKWKDSKVVYTEFGDDMHVLHKISRTEVKNVKWDGVVQIKELGYYQNYQVINNTEERVQRSLKNGKHLLLAGLANGAVGIVAGSIALTKGGTPQDIGFFVSVFGSRSWLPFMIAGGSNYNRTKKKCLIRMDE